MTVPEKLKDPSHFSETTRCSEIRAEPYCRLQHTLYFFFFHEKVIPSYKDIHHLLYYYYPLMTLTCTLSLLLLLLLLGVTAGRKKNCLLLSPHTTLSQIESLEQEEGNTYFGLFLALEAGCTHIRVQPGLYQGSLNRGLRSERLAELRGLGPPETVIFDMEGKDHFLFGSAPLFPQRLRLSNLTIQNSSSQQQGALWLHNYELVASAVHWQHNSLHITNGSVGGGALLTTGAAHLPCRLVDCLFFNNSIAFVPGSWGSLGTAVATYGSNLRVKHCEFRSNWQRFLGDGEEDKMMGGGTLFFWGSGGKQFLLRDSLFQDNTVEHGVGGALFLWDVDSDQTRFLQNRFLHNQASLGATLVMSFPYTTLYCSSDSYEEEEIPALWMVANEDDPTVHSLFMDDQTCSDYIEAFLPSVN